MLLLYHVDETLMSLSESLFLLHDLHHGLLVRMQHYILDHLEIAGELLLKHRLLLIELSFELDHDRLDCAQLGLALFAGLLRRLL
mmetsp:Transcript_39698/g.52020  ORF Transcript_39698/g.52020 Transcript_39698/m.52020 type:complete len:85 (+) Transcript_39698:1662-1916(+)